MSLSGSLGLYVRKFRVELLHRVFAHWMPPSMMTFVAPVPRTAVTSVCMPTALPAIVPVQVPPALPSRQHCHEAAAAASVLSFALLFGIGSLKRSKITCGLFWKRAATELQKLAEYDVFGIWSWAVAVCPAAALQCRSRITYTPLAMSRSTKPSIARR